ncbi:hypothetical protein DFQ27_008143 [Actinomortierella ambigua]|uniref:PQ-loop-domain-containing protein n=1 Tax=Actinomortierella ambigua TaxID=1343610 RepID=A0A9P6PR78_9FUNG|nr:hypothetical protein DFQ27_008143 [Actinomortierella ambigua]
MVAHTVLYWLATQGAGNGTIGGMPWNEALSNLAGSASIVCWFIVFTPQFWINYKRQSGESLSLVFLYIWLAGDIMNLVGAIMENLLLTMRVLAWYYTIADIALIAQVFYYRRTSVKATFEEAVITHPEILQQSPSHPPPPYHTIDERTALLGPGASSSSSGGYTAVTIPTSATTIAAQSADPQHHIHDNEHDQAIHDAALKAKSTQHQYQTNGQPFIDTFPSPRVRRPSSASALTSSSANYRTRMLKRRRQVRKALMIVLPLVATVFFIWAYHDWLQCTIEGDRGDDQESERCGRGQNGGHGKFPPPRTPSSPDDIDADFKVAMAEDDVIALLLGWGSAILYLGSRIPQIYKNWRLKSCEGLSLMMFMFSVFGNVFYVASIFLYSVEYDYVITNMPWWLGSGGTLVFDFTIFFQFYKYRHNHPLEEALKDAVAAGELDADDILPEDDDEEGSDGLDGQHQSPVDDHRALKQQHREHDLEAGLVQSIKNSSASTSSASTLGVVPQQQQQRPPVVAASSPVAHTSTTATGQTQETTASSVAGTTANRQDLSGSSYTTPLEQVVVTTTPAVFVEEVVSRSIPAPTTTSAPTTTPAPEPAVVTVQSSPEPVEEPQPRTQPTSEEPATLDAPTAAAPAEMLIEVTAGSVPEPPSTPPPPAESSSASAPEASSPSTPNKSKNKKKKKKVNKKK